MKREYLTPSKYSDVCAELFTEDSLEQNLTVRSLLGLSFKLRRLAFRKDVVPTTFVYPMESCKRCNWTNKRQKTSELTVSKQRANSSAIAQEKDLYLNPNPSS